MGGISRSTLAFALSPEEVLMSVKPISSGPNSGHPYNPNYFLPDSSLTLYQYNLINPNFKPNHPGKFKYPSVFSSYQTGVNGFNDLLNGGDGKKCKIKVSRWEDIIIRIVNVTCSGCVRRRVDVQRNNNVPFEAIHEPPACLAKVLKNLTEFYLPKNEEEGYFLASIITEYTTTQYNLRPSSSLPYTTFLSLTGSTPPPTFLPPPVRIRTKGREDRGYNGTLYSIKLLLKYPQYLPVFQQGIYACLTYAISSLDFGVYEVGSGAGFKGYKIFEWGDWCDFFAVFIEVFVLGGEGGGNGGLLNNVMQGKKNKGYKPEIIRENVIRNYHVLNDTFNVLCQRVMQVDPGREDVVASVERAFKSFLKVKNYVAEVSSMVDRYLSGQDCGSDGQIYSQHCAYLNGYRPYYNHSFLKIDVVECFSEMCNGAGRFVMWKGRIEQGLKEGWGEGIRGRKVIKGIKGEIERDAYGLLSSSGLRQVLLSGKCSPENVPFIGDPMLLPPRENEVEFLVDLTVYLSKACNRYFGLERETEAVDRDKERGDGEKREGEWKERAKIYKRTGFRFDFRGLSDWRNLVVMFLAIWIAKRVIF
ncbi:hypothetical protein TrST_g1214 [Triparma strigata]|uniref:Uncharacterized protein n=1 Tax=Triparma strigata TaxID=1606541 RepID=A0A9W7A2N3_9STRA|nr:hypothetical protein TrST_g1214 [Triparma strigata]